ncbi:MAG: lactate racemase domain-containing protein [Spirochaetales bacterium]|jgi:nickel-dependent lactate racemase|nr:lactate racemase domain-containing protein [Spirochaetales bacterium]
MDFVLQQNSWAGFEPVKISLPGDWAVEYHGIEADQWPVLNREEIRDRINSPYGSETLGKMARGKKQVVIVFDDITRGTPVQIIAETVLEELRQAGIAGDQIRFLCATGLHGAHTVADFVNKLGKKIVAGYEVFNHNPYENCVSIGTTARGVDVQINKEFMMCDLRIGIGAITPHHFNGYSGGGKILFPGIASIDTIYQNHSTAVNFLSEKKLNLVVGMGRLENDGMRKEVEEMAGMVDNFFKIDCLYNTSLQPVKIFAGNYLQTFYTGVQDAIRGYATQPVRDKDVVVVNANAKANEATIATNMAVMGVRPEGGDVVIVNFSKMGQMTHYLFGAFGTCIGGRMWGKLSKTRPHIRRIIYFSPYHSYTDLRWIGEREKIVCVSTWKEVMDELKSHGPGTRCSVLADGTLEYYRDV